MGLDHANLYLLEQAPAPASANKDLVIQMVVECSIQGAKPSFLMTFFISQELDFMFMTEVWLHAGESTPFFKLLLFLVH